MVESRKVSKAKIVSTALHCSQRTNRRIESHNLCYQQGRSLPTLLTNIHGHLLVHLVHQVASYLPGTWTSSRLRKGFGSRKLDPRLLGVCGALTPMTFRPDQPQARASAWSAFISGEATHDRCQISFVGEADPV